MNFFTLFFLCLPLCFPSIGLAAISPSQVLVLYNADWTADAPLTEPGQDSKEIADHYVRMHTDPKTGEKPYSLGFSCQHGIKILDEYHHLNQSHLQEESKDNKSGVELIKRRWLADRDVREDELRDSRLVEFSLPGGSEGWKLETLQLALKPDDGSSIALVKNGLIEKPGQVAGNHGKGWTIRFNAKTFTAGGVTVHASCESVDGEKFVWEPTYVDIDNVKLSRTGADGVRDDQNYLEDIELPLKAFLENPENARPDGTLLKDHILFIVVAYGLPRTASAPYGIARGITEQLNNFGTMIDFGQRLQLLYYDVEKVMGATPKSHRFASKEPFTSFFFRAPQAWPLYGTQANPFVHSQLYQKKVSLADLIDPVQFSRKNRNKYPDRHLYFVMRIDAPNPLLARGLIDRAVYASTFAGPDMGRVSAAEPAEMKERIGRSKTGKWLWEKGFYHLYYGGAGRNRLELFRLTADGNFLNTEPVYLPGGVGGTVISHNGWKKGEMLQDLNRGVTATVGAAKVYRGAPHIHNKSWWDDEILYPYLLQGRTLGEAFLMNQIHLGWISTFIGDPLYRLPNVVKKSSEPLQFDPRADVEVKVIKNHAGDKEVWLQVDLGSTATKPVVGQLKASSVAGAEVICSTFEAKPYVRLGDRSVCGQSWQLETIDPYGQRFAAKVLIECHGD